ncbi:MAG: UDP-3-O-(3-hydroxymyristoyl)glucosamine N-acyltransferase [Planctomycetota bacterium]|jgi:UDP-3-O-[3-hydroxymyristoyl] glucosamine N-acyltransferase
MELTLSQLAKKIDAELLGEGACKICSINAIASAGQNDVTFVTDEKFIPELEKSKAAAVIVNKPIKVLDMPQLIVKNVDQALIKTLSIFAPELKKPVPGIDPTAVVAKDAKIGKNVSIGPRVVIDENAEIQDNSVLKAGCVVGENSKVGKDCRIDSNVVIYHNCIIGSNCIIQANTTIGSTGYGYAQIDGQHHLIPHNGGVKIEDFVEIGANCCVDRAKFGNTIIGAGTKIDNLVQIGHNVIIGKCCLIIAQVALAGSAKIGDGVVMAGHSGVADNVEVGDRVVIGAKSAVMKSVEAGQVVLGIPARPKAMVMKSRAIYNRLPQLAEQIKKLNEKVKKLEASKDNKK